MYVCVEQRRHRCRSTQRRDAKIFATNVHCFHIHCIPYKYIGAREMFNAETEDQHVFFFA